MSKSRKFGWLPSDQRWFYFFWYVIWLDQTLRSYMKMNEESLPSAGVLFMDSCWYGNSAMSSATVSYRTSAVSLSSNLVVGICEPSITMLSIFSDLCFLARRTCMRVPPSLDNDFTESNRRCKSFLHFPTVAVVLSECVISGKQLIWSPGFRSAEADDCSLGIVIYRIRALYAGKNLIMAGLCFLAIVQAVSGAVR